MPRFIFNNEKHGIEIYFEKKPNNDVLSLLRENRWRWHRNKFCWYNRDSTANREFAEYICSGAEIIETLNSQENEIKAVRTSGINCVSDNTIDYNLSDISLIEVITKIIRGYGIGVLSEASRVQNILSDLLANRRKELNIAKVAISEGVIGRIIQDSQKPPEIQKKTLSYSIRYMTEELGMGYESSTTVLLAFQAAITKEVLRAKGKSICHQLKEMRRQFAEANGIDFEEEDCTSEAPCRGTCAYCDGKTRELVAKAKQTRTQVNYPWVEVNTSRKQTIIEETMSNQCDGFMRIPEGIDEELPFN